ncbi:MAG: dephospho-CoA kinase [Candidatus Sungbacteria bacterium]|nr:dephospho-CoA kinase [Candidatus Sungbacteria bacterium]
MRKKRIVIGLTGFIAAGKGTVVELLKNEFGFTGYSTSDRVREAARAAGSKNPTRELMQAIGNEMQERFGGDIFAKIIAGMIWAEQNDHVVVDSIRHPEEYVFFAQYPYFVMLAVTAPFEERFRRVQSRSRAGDPKTIQEFYAIDQRDQGVGQDLSGQQVKRCVELADYTLENKDTREEFEQQVRDFLALL